MYIYISYFNFSPGCEGSKRLITEIARALQGVASNWFEVCTLLGIPVNKLNSIREECDRSTEACLKGAIEVHCHYVCMCVCINFTGIHVGMSQKAFSL